MAAEFSFDGSIGDFRPECTRRILDSAIHVHRALGPGLLESTYRICLMQRLRLDGMEVRAEVPIGIDYCGLSIDSAFRADLIVDDAVILELKAVERLLPLHAAQLYTYLRLAKRPIGLLINFNVPRLMTGVRRVIAPRFHAAGSPSP